MEVTFDGVRIGIFTGSLRYTFYPGTPLIQQAALVSTHEPDTAYYYDAGLEMTAEQDRWPGGNMESHISYYDVAGKLQEITPPYGSERHSAGSALSHGGGEDGRREHCRLSTSASLFLCARLHHQPGVPLVQLLAGQGWTGMQQYPDDDTTIDPWMNAPPESVQEMGLFLLPSAKDSSAVLKDVLALHAQRSLCAFGWIRNLCTALAPCLHSAGHGKGTRLAATFQAGDEAIGIDSAMIMDFHGDGHPADLTDLRLHELDEYYKACRAQSDSELPADPF